MYKPYRSPDSMVSSKKSNPYQWLLTTSLVVPLGLSFSACTHAQKTTSSPAAKTAEDYDRQWSATRLPQYLYEAGLAYEAAGYDAHAITRWNQYLDEKKQVSASTRAEIERRITEAKVRTVPVIVHLLPAEVTKEGVKARFRYLSGTEGSEAKNPFFNLNIQTSSQAVDLDPGEWEIRVDAPGFRTAKVQQNVVQGKAPIRWEIALQIAPEPVTTELRIGPQEAIDAGLTVYFISSEEEEKRFKVEGERASLPLSPGTWKLQAQAPGFEMTTQEFTVPLEEGPLSVNLPLRAKQRDGGSSPSPLSLGLIAGGFIPASIGLGLAIHTTNHFELVRKANLDTLANTDKNFPDLPPLDPNAMESPQDERGIFVNQQYPVQDYHRFVVSRINLQSASVGIAASSLGFWLAGVMDVSKHKNKLWFGEMGLGGALTIGGVVLLVKSQQRLKNEVKGEAQGGPWRARDEEIVSIRNAYLGAGALMGAGVGMVVGAGIGLLTNYIHSKKANSRNTKKSALAPYWDTLSAGIVLQHRF